MKIEITEAGVFDSDTKEITVGTVINIKGDNLPAWLVGKARVVAASPAKGAVLTVNPASDDTVAGGAA